MAYRFEALETIEAMVNGKNNRYLQGKRYTVRDGAEYVDLDKQVKRWAKKKRVRILGDVPNTAPGKARSK